MAADVRVWDGSQWQSIMGPPGPQGEEGADGLPSTVPGPQGERGADSVIPGLPGERGERGADGIATREELESLAEERFADLQVRSFADSWRGVWKDGDSYTRGNLAQWDGMPWLALNDTSAKPGTSADWQIFTKKGRDGRDARK